MGNAALNTDWVPPAPAYAVLHNNYNFLEVFMCIHRKYDLFDMSWMHHIPYTRITSVLWPLTGPRLRCEGRCVAGPDALQPKVKLGELLSWGDVCRLPGTLPLLRVRIREFSEADMLRLLRKHTTQQHINTSVHMAGKIWWKLQICKEMKRKLKIQKKISYCVNKHKTEWAHMRTTN